MNKRFALLLILLGNLGGVVHASQMAVATKNQSSQQEKINKELLAAVEQGDAEEVKELLSGRAKRPLESDIENNVALRDSEGRNLLMIAIMHRQVAVVDEILHSPGNWWDVKDAAGNDIDYYLKTYLSKQDRDYVDRRIKIVKTIHEMVTTPQIHDFRQHTIEPKVKEFFIWPERRDDRD